MPRKARLVIPGALYHVMARCLSHHTLFPGDADREHFLALLETCLISANTRCYAWALMNTHYHLLLRLGDQELCALMKPLNMRYALHHRTVTGRRGTLFMDRFKSIVTQDQNYFLELLRYIHLNPVRAGICPDLAALEKYPWSGHGVLMGKFNRSFQDTATILRLFGSNSTEARENYSSFLLEGLQEKSSSNALVRLVRQSNEGSETGRKPICWVIGDQPFVAEVVSSAQARRLRITRFEREGGKFDDITRQLCQIFSVPAEDLRQRHRGGQQTAARKAFAYIAAKEFNAPEKKIGEFLGIGPTAVSNMIAVGKRLVEERKIVI
jgi:REP element-mobilizing transposase RayT